MLKRAKTIGPLGCSVILLPAILSTVATVTYQAPSPLFCEGKLSAGFPLPIVCDASGESPLSSVERIDWADLDNIYILGIGADLLFFSALLLAVAVLVGRRAEKAIRAATAQERRAESGKEATPKR